MRAVTVKVCGLTRAEDVAFCHAAGVQYVGFIMAVESPRRILPAAAAAMPKDAAGRVAKRVGVFTGHDIAELERQADEASFDFLQLHGGQDAALCRALGPERVIKVFWPERHDRETLQREMDRFAPVCAHFLFDAGKSGGGAGSGFAWERLKDLAIPRPWFLAGGIGPDTAKAAAAMQPFGLDVNSGVEISPGVKDVAKIQAVLRNLDQ